MTDLHPAPVADGARIRAALRELLRPFRGRAVAATAALVAGAAVSLLTAPLLGRIVDLVATRQPADAVTGPVLVLVVVAIAQGLLAVLGITLVARVGESMLAQLREQFVARALALPLERIEEAGSGDLTSRVTSDVTRVAEAVRDAVPEFARAALLIALTLVGMAVLDWRFLLAALCAVPVQVVTARWYLRNSTSLYAEQRRVAGVQQQQLLDTVGGAATVRAFGLAGEHTERVRTRSEHVVQLGLRVMGMQTRFFGRLNLAEWIGVAAVLTAGFLLVRGGLATIGTASAAALYFINLFGPINQVLFLLDTAQSATASLARIVGVADLPAEENPADHAEPADGRVQVKDLGHSYVDGHPVLAAVDLDVPAGSTVALVGSSGAGKSTLAKLVAGVHHPTTGHVAIGGAALADLGPAGIRSAVALITQEVHVFAGPLADDLRLARPDADRRRAAGRAHGRRRAGVGAGAARRARHRRRRRRAHPHRGAVAAAGAGAAGARRPARRDPGRGHRRGRQRRRAGARGRGPHRDRRPHGPARRAPPDPGRRRRLRRRAGRGPGRGARHARRARRGRWAVRPALAGVVGAALRVAGAARPTQDHRAVPGASPRTPQRPDR